MKTVLTGIKPTGKPHFGNYVGVIKPTLKLASDSSDNARTLVFIANYHALNQERDPMKIRDNTYGIAATFLAFGLNPDEVIFYRQSEVPEIFELATILSNLVPKGLMNRSHAYKSAVDRNRQLCEGKDVAENGMDLDAGINMGLYNYPVLMAADILLFQSTTVPVGKDQTQHIEVARDIAGMFNHVYGETLTIPESFIVEDTAEVLGLDGRKMSKSYGNTIPVFEDREVVEKLIMKIKTDSRRPEECKDPEESTVFQLYKEFAEPNKIDEMRHAFQNGEMGHGDSKKLLIEAVNDVLEEPRHNYQELISNRKLIDGFLLSGAENARSIACQTMLNVREYIGV